MAYRPEWFPKNSMSVPYDILPIAQWVVGFIRGSYDTIIGDHDLNVKALEWVVENWDYKYECMKCVGDEKFDEAILNLIKIALEMEEKDKKRRDLLASSLNLS